MIAHRQRAKHCRYQGESDAAEQERVHSFQRATREVLQAFRGALMAPALPLVQVAITCESPKAPLAASINALQRSLQLPRLATVDARGLQLQEDGMHLTASAQHQLGARLCTTYLGLVNPDSRATLHV
jgi:hypothetical protein